MDLLEVLKNIEEPDYNIMKKTKERLDSLVKPIGSLGYMEDISKKISGITGKIFNKLDKRCIVVMSADNGVCEEEVSVSPQEVTALHTINFAKGMAAINVLAKNANSNLEIIDIGIKKDLNNPLIQNKKIKYGTDNIAKGPAMSREEAINAIKVGIEKIKELKDKGYSLIGTGEMGIGNTTTSSACLIALTGESIDNCVGTGAGIDEQGLINKKRIINKALEINRPEKNDPIDIVAKVGGLDICGMAGLFIGAAYYKIPIVIDGFISVVAALIAFKLNNRIADYMIQSHVSQEVGYMVALNSMGMNPFLNLNMRLGEGTGCPLMFNIIENSLLITEKMATFEETMISDDFQKDKK